MNEKIRKLLESNNKEDQLIALSLIANTENINLDYIPDNNDMSKPWEYISNRTGIEGFIYFKEKILLLGSDCIRFLEDEQTVEDIYPGHYNELDKNLQPLN